MTDRGQETLSAWPLMDSVSRHIAEQPAAPALIWRDEQVTYGELGELLRQAAETLAALALPDGVAVGIIGEKSPRAIALILACLAADRPFLLPSADLGPTALAALLQQAGCSQILSPNGERSPFTAMPSPALTAESVSAHSLDAAFLLTTSGSTGVPKIVPICRAAIDRFAAWAGEHFGITRGTTVLNYAPLNFDLCLLDIWTSLARGARVVLVEKDRATQAEYLIDLIEANDVGLIQAVPLFFHVIIETTRREPRRFSSVEHIVVTGDSMPLRTWKALGEIFDAATLHNLYGCTETNDSFIHEVDVPDVLRRGAVPIGSPLPGTRARLVGPNGTALTGAGKGELWVSTPFQTAGYLNPDLTNGRFVAGADAADPARAFFRTGDLVRRHPDGCLTLEGRADFQVKVRGVLVNLNEVEAALLEHGRVLEAAVVAVADTLAGNRLHALVRGAELNGLELREHCAARLARAAIPSAITFVDASLPKTSTGKVDRSRVRELAAPGRINNS